MPARTLLTTTCKVHRNFYTHSNNVPEGSAYAQQIPNTAPLHITCGRHFGLIIFIVTNQLRTKSNEHHPIHNRKWALRASRPNPNNTMFLKSSCTGLMASQSRKMKYRGRIKKPWVFTRALHMDHNILDV